MPANPCMSGTVATTTTSPVADISDAMRRSSSALLSGSITFAKSLTAPVSCGAGGCAPAGALTTRRQKASAT